MVRNKVRRRLREVARLTPVKDGWDIVFIARRGSPNANYHQLARAMDELLKRAKLLSSSTNPGFAPTADRNRPEGTGQMETPGPGPVFSSQGEAEE